MKLELPHMLKPFLCMLCIFAVVWVEGCGGGGGAGIRIVFLHHSTGRAIWDGGVKKWFKEYNSRGEANYRIDEKVFPKESPYGWNNYPFDYWNIWVKNAGAGRYMDEPTLEILTRSYDVIVLKHCFPVSDIGEDTGLPSVESAEKTVGNYKLQYDALKEKMLEFPGTKFIVWTGAALVRAKSDEYRACRARAFFEWVRDEWDESGDNIYVWDFFELETAGGLYLKPEYARSETNSHPNEEFARMAAPLFCKRVVDVIEGRGDSGEVTGK
jgi:hypothetical protein